MRLSLEAKTLKSPVPFEEYVDESFVRASVAASVAI
jgi:hypothetical protein